MAGPVKKHKVDDRVVTRVRTWEVGKTQVKGTPYVRVRLEGYITWEDWLTPDCMERAMKVLKLMGFTGSSIKMLGHDKALSPDIELTAVIGEVREVGDNTYYDAKFINPAVEFGFNDKAKKLIESDPAFDIDTRKYLGDAVDDSAMGSMGSNENMNISTEASFTSDDIPF